MSIKVIVEASGIVCIVGGATVNGTDIQELATGVDMFVAADGGADHLLAASVMPVAVIGDLDSLSDGARTRFAALLHHIPEQDTTDFEKALLRVRSSVILALGFTGGRIDHSLAVLNVMARNSHRAVVLLGSEDVSFVCPAAGCRFALPAGTRVSLMPLSDVQATATGLQWPLSDAQMHPAGMTSASNVATGGDVVVAVQGPLLVTLPRAFLATALQAAVRAE